MEGSVIKMKDKPKFVSVVLMVALLLSAYSDAAPWKSANPGDSRAGTSVVNTSFAARHTKEPFVLTDSDGNHFSTSLVLADSSPLPLYGTRHRPATVGHLT